MITSLFGAPLDDRPSVAAPCVRANEALPPLGDTRKTYAVTLTEPEINTIHAVYGFMDGQVRAVVERLGSLSPDFELVQRWLEQYHPVLQQLSERLEVFDDGNIPLQSANAESSLATHDSREEHEPKSETPCS